jgi:hypothetical protein
VVGSLTFLTPLGGLLGVLVVLPLAALALVGRRLQRARAVLRLVAPGGRGTAWRAIAIASVPLLIALALAQPALRRHGTNSVRADAAAFVVVDTSASMGAAAGPHAPTRLQQAKRIALAAGSDLGGLPLGVANFTDRVLPNAFPTADHAVFSSTIRSLGIDSPPPRETSRVATSFSQLDALGNASFFTRAQKHRALLLITDGESRAFDAATLAQTLATAPRVRVVVVRVGGGGDRLYASDGRASTIYRADPERARQSISQLVSATGGRSFTGGPRGIAAAVRRALGSGPAVSVQSELDTRDLSPYIMLLCFLPLVPILVGSLDFARAERRLP